MTRTLTLLCLAWALPGCLGDTPAACGSADDCPGAQVCTVGVCVRPGAAPDMSGAGGVGGDGGAGGQAGAGGQGGGGLGEPEAACDGEDNDGDGTVDDGATCPMQGRATGMCVAGGCACRDGFVDTPGAPLCEHGCETGPTPIRVAGLSQSPLGIAVSASADEAPPYVAWSLPLIEVPLSPSLRVWSPGMGEVGLGDLTRTYEDLGVTSFDDGKGLVWARSRVGARGDFDQLNVFAVRPDGSALEAVFQADRREHFGPATFIALERNSVVGLALAQEGEIARLRLFLVDLSAAPAEKGEADVPETARDDYDASLAPQVTGVRDMNSFRLSMVVGRGASTQLQTVVVDASDIPEFSGPSPTPEYLPLGAAVLSHAATFGVYVASLGDSAAPRSRVFGFPELELDRTTELTVVPLEIGRALGLVWMEAGISVLSLEGDAFNAVHFGSGAPGVQRGLVGGLSQIRNAAVGPQVGVPPRVAYVTTSNELSFIQLDCQ